MFNPIVAPLFSVLCTQQEIRRSEGSPVNSPKGGSGGAVVVGGGGGGCGGVVVVVVVVVVSSMQQAAISSSRVRGSVGGVP